MKTTAVTANVTQITRWRFVNAFLVGEEDGFTLVATTVGGGADSIIAAAENMDGTIRRVALTHGHGDHFGSLDALRKRLGGSVEVLMPELDARIRDRCDATLEKLLKHADPKNVERAKLQLEKLAGK